MAKQILRPVNSNDVAIISGAIALNVSTSITISTPDIGRIFFCVNNNDAANGVWIKLQAASVDNVKKGIFIGAKSKWQMPVDNIYTGEISAIAATNNPDVFVTEY